jgi:hypothetical protein
MPSAKTTTPLSRSLAVAASRPPPWSSPSERITSARCLALCGPKRRSAVSRPAASSVPGRGSDPGSTVSSSRSSTAPSRVSGDSISPSPSVCTKATRSPGIAWLMRRTIALAAKRRDGATSGAAIDSDESRRKTTSTPRRSTFSRLSPQRGRASASAVPSTDSTTQVTASASRRRL